MKKPIINYIILFLIAIVLGSLAGWIVNGVLGITSTKVLNTIRVTWILGIVFGFLLGKNWKVWKGWF